MDELIKMIKDDLPGAVKLLTADQRDPKEIDAKRKEFIDLERDMRETQVGSIQKDKTVGKGETARIVRPVKFPIPFQNKIVNTATAFEVGTEVTLNASQENILSEEIKRLWRETRMDDKLQKAKKLQKSELQCALLFTIQDLAPDNLINRILGANKQKEIKCRILENKNGTMSPYFDPFGDMIAFTWQFITKNVEGKEVQHAWIYTAKTLFKASTETGSMELRENKPHGFGKIPIVFLSQEHVEWHIAEAMIDRLEVTVSKLGSSNDYTAHPILLLYGEVKGAPGKDEDGKAMQLPVKETGDGKTLHGDVKYLTREGQAESVKLEVELLEKYIHSLTSTPDISFDNVKGLGPLSGIAIKLMFLDSMVKAKMNEGENRTIVQRIISIMISGNVNTTNLGMKNLSESTYFDIVFNSIIPEDIQSIVEVLSTAVSGGFMSKKTAVEALAYTDNSQEEIDRIAQDKVKEPVAE